MSEGIESWNTARLDELCTKGQYGWTTKASQNGRVRFLRTTDITKGNVNWSAVPFCESVPVEIEKFSVQAGDILISRAGSVGFAVLIETVPDETVFASYLIRFKPKPNIDGKYLAFYLQSPMYWKQIASASSGIAVLNVNAKKLGAIEVPFPSELRDQILIAKKLEHLATQIRSAQARLDGVLQLLARLRESLLVSATSGSLTEKWRLKNNLAEGHWKTIKLKEICREITVGHVGKMVDEYIEDGIPFLRSQNVRPFLFDKKNLLFVSSEFHKKLKKSKLTPGDVAVVRSGVNTGQCCVIPEELSEANCSDIVIVRPGEKLSSEYACILINASSIQSFIRSEQVGVAIGHFNVGSMKETEVSLPSMAEQREIVRRVHSDLRRIAHCEQVALKSKAYLNSLLPAILQKAFKGELLPQRQIVTV